MQYILDVDGKSERLEWAEDRLKAYFVSFPPRYILLRPVSQLVMSLLGGQTYGHVSRPAHQNLIRTFQIWSEVRDAPYDQLYSLIRDVTWADLKAERLKSILGRISGADGDPTLSHLRYNQ